jgi:hypothetical protein
MSSPFIQIFSVGVMGIAGAFRRAATSAGGGEGVADLRGRAFYIVGCVQSLLDSGHGIALAQEIAHHRGRDHRGPGVGLPGAGDVGSRPVDRFEE